MISLSPESKIYIICPANCATGGPEALHQLAYHLKLNGFSNVFMYYTFTENEEGIDPVHPFYRKYGTMSTTQIEVKENNLIITPETILEPVFNKEWKMIRKAIWWLSVTNYYIVINPKLQRAKRRPIYWLRKIYSPMKFGTFNELKEANVYNISHSYYSEAHLKENGIIPDSRISDYMNQAFFRIRDADSIKENIILYNPMKNGKFLKKIIECTSELNWVPIQNMSPKEVALLMNRSKVYVDFGYHPGKERMPREACIMGCCLIIGKDGSARYKEDMPIPDRFRFEKQDTEIPEIISRIKECLIDYETVSFAFESYRKCLNNEEAEFVEGIKATFKLVGN